MSVSVEAFFDIWGSKPVVAWSNLGFDLLLAAESSNRPREAGSVPEAGSDDEGRY